MCFLYKMSILIKTTLKQIHFKPRIQILMFQPSILSAAVWWSHLRTACFKLRQFVFLSVQNQHHIPQKAAMEQVCQAWWKVEKNIIILSSLKTSTASNLFKVPTYIWDESNLWLVQSIQITWTLFLQCTFCFLNSK